MGNETVGGPDLRDLIEDGRFARKRAVDRLCALGRELDGDGFDEAAWRGLLEREGLSAIEAHLWEFEARFDARYPVSPVAEAIPEPTVADLQRAAATIRSLKEPHPVAGFSLRQLSVVQAAYASTTPGAWEGHGKELLSGGLNLAQFDLWSEGRPLEEENAFNLLFCVLAHSWWPHLYRFVQAHWCVRDGDGEGSPRSHEEHEEAGGARP